MKRSTNPGFVTVPKLNGHHAREMIALKSAHARELSKLKEFHEREIAQLRLKMRQLQARFATMYPVAGKIAPGINAMNAFPSNKISDKPPRIL